MENKTIHIYKEKNVNFFIGSYTKFSADDLTTKGYERVKPSIASSILKSWEDTYMAGNIPTRWELFTDPTNSEPEAEFYAFDILARYVENKMKEKGMTMYSLAKKAGIRQITLSYFLKGKADLTLDSYVRLVSALGDWDKFCKIVKL